MNSKQIALTAALLAVVFLAHAAGRFTQIGGAQFAPSIAIYVLMALLLAAQTRWAEKIGTAFLVGILTMVATSSPFPPANIPAHGVGFLTASFLALLSLKNAKEVGVARQVIIGLVTVVVSWSLFALFTWIGLTGTPFTNTNFARFGVQFGSGFVAWYLFGFVGVGIPTLIIVWILTPVLYKAVRPALVRQGMMPA